MSALKSALRVLPAALAVSFLSGCGWYRAAWEAEQGGRPHNHGSAAQAGDAKDDGNSPTAPAPNAAEPKSDEPRADEAKTDEPTPESKAQRKAPRPRSERRRATTTSTGAASISAAPSTSRSRASTRTPGRPSSTCTMGCSSSSPITCPRKSRPRRRGSRRASVSDDNDRAAPRGRSLPYEEDPR